MYARRSGESFDERGALCERLTNVVVVTGGAGFIGSHTVDLLLSCDEIEILVVDNLCSGSRSNVPSDERVKLLELDVSDARAVERLVSELSGERVSILHLAAIVRVEEVRSDPELGFRVNVNGTHNLLELARRIDAERFVFASSAAVYGDPERLPIDESHPLRPKSLYGVTKLLGERLVERYSSEHGLSCASLRYFNVYGPRMRRGPYAGVVLAFLEALLSGSRPVVYGDGAQTRDFVFVSDVVEANVAALTSRTEGPLNVGTGVETSVMDLLGVLSELVGVAMEPLFAPPRPDDVRRSVASIERIRETLGWEPRVGLREGLRATIEHYRVSGSGCI
ncbi:MAG: GDP-mannose 4,6-dehydratase [Fervidicoccaceae archaeon]